MPTAVKLEQPTPIAHGLRGFGGQLDCELFTEVGQPGGCTPAQLDALGRAINMLKPGHCRIFVTNDMLQGKARDSLLDTLKLAQAAGANVNLTWWNGPYFAGVGPPTKPCTQRHGGAFIGDQLMTTFAGVIELVRRQRRPVLDCVTHITIQNEVNDQDIGLKCDVVESQKVYKRLYVKLDELLKNRPDPLGRKPNLRQTVDFVGGDLVDHNSRKVENSSQADWLAFMQQKMKPPLLDGYSIHVYWSPGELAKPQKRLQALSGQIKKHGIRLPIYVTEYGVKIGNQMPGELEGRNIEDTVEAGFEHAWFNALAPQYGCVGFAKWVLYRTDGDQRAFGRWGMICPPRQQFRPLRPTYFVTWLFNHLVDPGWLAAGTGQSGDGLVLVSKFRAPQGVDHAFVVLNRGKRRDVQLTGLTKHFPYFAAVWNRQGDKQAGQVRGLPRKPADRTGNLTVGVGREELLALSTRPITR